MSPTTLCHQPIACFGITTKTVCLFFPAALPCEQQAHPHLLSGETIDFISLPLQHHLVNDGLINALPRKPCSELRTMSGLPIVSKEARKVALEAASQKAAIAAAAAGGHLQEIRDACKAKCAGRVSSTAALLQRAPVPRQVCRAARCMVWLGTAALPLAGRPSTGLHSFGDLPVCLPS